MVSAPRVSGAARFAVWSEVRPPSVTAVWTAVLEPLAEAGRMSMEQATQTANSSARMRFFIVSLLNQYAWFSQGENWRVSA